MQARRPIDGSATFTTVTSSPATNSLMDQMREHRNPPVAAELLHPGLPLQLR